MRHRISPLLVTVIFAAAAAALLAGAASLPLRSAHRPVAMNLSIFLCLAAYSAFLARVSGRNLRDLFAPLFLLAAVLAASGSVAGFALPASAGLSWLRSGICFPGPTARRVCAEALTCAGGLALTWLLLPQSPYGLALGMWMFGLVQALYFLALDVEHTGRSAKEDWDRERWFTVARRRFSTNKSFQERSRNLVCTRMFEIPVQTDNLERTSSRTRAAAS